MQRLNYFRRVVLAVSLLLPTIATGAPVQYIISGTISGDVSGTLFTDAELTFNGFGDTATIASCGVGCLTNGLASGTITLAGFGTGDMLFAPYAFVSANVGGFGDSNIFDFLYVSAAALTGHDLATNLGPIAAGTGFPGQGPLQTTFGDITISSVQGAGGSFQTIVGTAVVPEPGTMALVFAGMAALAVRRRMR